VARNPLPSGELFALRRLSHGAGRASLALGQSRAGPVSRWERRGRRARVCGLARHGGKEPNPRRSAMN